MTDDESLVAAHRMIKELSDNYHALHKAHQELRKRVGGHDSTINAHGDAIVEHHDRLTKLEGRASIGSPAVYAHTPQQMADMRKSFQRNLKS